MSSCGYLVNDNRYYSFNIAKAGEAPSMCLVNNIPHIKFRNAQHDTLKNGYTEIGEIRFTGDAGRVLNSVPIYVWIHPTPQSTSKLIVKSNGNTVAVKSD